MIFTPHHILQIRESRWFADKEAEIGQISAEETFALDSEIQCVIAKFLLKRNSETIIKRYFIPILGDSSEISDTEHLLAFQQAMFRHYRDSSIISGSDGGFLRFHPLTPDTSHITPAASRPLTMKYSSSNILTVVSTDHSDIISKTYKDLRGDCGQEGRMWAPNPEAEKYEALMSAAYPNIAEIYGAAYYHPASGKAVPFNILMEAINSTAQVGEIFNRSLQNFETISDFTSEVAKTVARMHAAFLKYDKPEFQAIPATEEDICLWHNRMSNNFSQAIFALKRRSSQYPDASMLANLIRKLETLTIHPLSSGSVMKSQIHGDLHADQGLVADRICWLDFEGPPAKEPVAINQDFRENPLLDLAGMIQAFWYMAHVRLYELSGFDYQHPEDHEKQRQASLAFAGVYNTSESDKQTIYRLKSWVNDMTSAFIESYLDEIGTLNIHDSILKNQDRSSAKMLINYWVSDRAIHELRYETYGRNWGWEAIPASRILQYSQIIPENEFPGCYVPSLRDSDSFQDHIRKDFSGEA